MDIKIFICPGLNFESDDSFIPRGIYYIVGARGREVRRPTESIHDEQQSSDYSSGPPAAINQSTVGAVREEVGEMERLLLSQSYN